MTLSLAFIACQKKKFLPKETSVRENITEYNVENNIQNMRAHNSSSKPVFW